MRTDTAVLSADHENFKGNVLIFHNRKHLLESCMIYYLYFAMIEISKNTAIYFPAELTILAQNCNGQLNCYSMNLDDFFGSSWTNPYLRLEHSWSGHQFNIKSLLPHSSLPLMASISGNGDIDFFKVSVPQV